MKKILSVMLAAVLICGLLAGCAVKKVPAKDFNYATNQMEVMHGFSFDVPENWKEKDSSSEIKHYYPTDGMLMVQYSEMSGNILDKAIQQEFTKGLKAGFKKFKILKEGEEKINGEKAYRLKAKIEIKKLYYDLDMLSFNCDGGVITFMMHTLKSSKKDYNDDFNKVAKSIRKELPFDRTITQATNVLSDLQTAGKYNFTSTGVDKLKDGTTMQTLIDTEKGVIITFLGNSQEEITLLDISSENDVAFTSACIAGLLAIDVVLPKASKFLAGLSPESLKEMRGAPEGAKTEVFDGVSFSLMKMDSGKYRFMLQRDNETQKDYEKYLKDRKTLDS